MEHLDTEPIVNSNRTQTGSRVSQNELFYDVIIPGNTATSYNDATGNDRGMRRTDLSEQEDSVDTNSRSYQHSHSGRTEGFEIIASYDKLTILQAQVFLEDAQQYHSIHHKVDVRSLKLYRWYYCKPIHWFRYLTIFVIHMLAFFEWPSSITTSWTSDIRNPGVRLNPPCGVMESIELICLLLFVFDAAVKFHLMGHARFWKSKWLMTYWLILLVSLCDWCVTVGYGCTEVVRFRRILRPFFLLQNSSLMKKTVNCLRRTLPEIFSILVLLALHVYFFTLFGMLLFPKPKSFGDYNITGLAADVPQDNITQSTDKEGDEYFHSLGDSFMSLLVLLTTANNPDVTMLAYKKNRFYAVYFIVFLIVGLYCLMSMLTAVIYNQFRGYFLDSMQSSFFRRKVAVRAAFEVLRRKRWNSVQHLSIQTVSDGVPVKILKHVVEESKIHPRVKQAILTELKRQMGNILNSYEFNSVFDIMDRQENKSKERPQMVWKQNLFLQMVQTIVASRYFTYFGNLVALGNVLCISIELTYEYDNSLGRRNSALGVINLVFICYYLLEQILKVWAMGWKVYFHEKGNAFEGIITIMLVILEGVFISVFGIPLIGGESSVGDVSLLWDLVRVVNMLIMVRLLRIIPQIKSMSLVASTLADLVVNLKAFAGILVVIYYSFAILGLEIFQGKIKFDASNNTNNSAIPYECGTYQQLDYWANNFDDFAASLVVLWDIMVVNNWHVFLAAYSKATGTKWSQLYFIAWWLLSVVICINLFTALILENFIMKWDRNQQAVQRADRSDSVLSTHPLTVHEMFRERLREPDDQELLNEIHMHHFLDLGTLPSS